MKYYKRNWDEDRGDEQDHWGTSIWYFEVLDDGFPIRQIEVYKHGPVLKYDEENPEDNYGGLAEAALDMEDFEEFTIEKEEFEAAWGG